MEIKNFMIKPINIGMISTRLGHIFVDVFSFKDGCT